MPSTHISVRRTQPVHSSDLCGSQRQRDRRVCYASWMEIQPTEQAPVLVSEGLSRRSFTDPKAVHPAGWFHTVRVLTVGPGDAEQLNVQAGDPQGQLPRERWRAPHGRLTRCRLQRDRHLKLLCVFGDRAAAGVGTQPRPTVSGPVSQHREEPLPQGATRQQLLAQRAGTGGRHREKRGAEQAGDRWR